MSTGNFVITKFYYKCIKGMQALNILNFGWRIRGTLLCVHCRMFEWDFWMVLEHAEEAAEFTLQGRIVFH